MRDRLRQFEGPWVSSPMAQGPASSRPSRCPKLLRRTIRARLSPCRQPRQTFEYSLQIGQTKRARPSHSDLVTFPRGHSDKKIVRKRVWGQEQKSCGKSRGG
jgi:hypothetical protein